MGIRKWINSNTPMGAAEYRAEKLRYFRDYTGKTYQDALLTIPTYSAELISKAIETILGDRTPDWARWEKITDASLIYKKRERLRAEWETLPGLKNLESNLLAAIPIVFVGMPAAQLTQHYAQSAGLASGEIRTATVAATATAQILAGWTTVMINEVRRNRYKYTDNDDKLKARKIFSGVCKQIKTVASYDLLYFPTKGLVQRWVLGQGFSPWASSSGIDLLVSAPTWGAVGIAFGLHNGFIETERMKEFNGAQGKSN